MRIGLGLDSGGAATARRAVGLLVPGVRFPVLSLARSQVSAFSTAPAADGATWLEYAADAPRFAAAARRLLAEPSRTNAVRNPRGEGSAIGAPGTWPTHWQVSSVVGSVTGAGTEDGLAFFEHRFTGAAATTAAIFDFAAASPGQVWSGAFFARLVAGALTNATVQVNVVFTSAGSGTGTTLANNTANIAPTSSSLGSQRFVLNGQTAPASTVSAVLRIRVVATGAYDFTLRLGAPQLEQGAFATTPILPTAGAPGASARGADILTASLSSLGVDRAMTILWSGVLPQAAPSGADQLLFRADDGSADNIAGVLNPGGGSSIVARRSTAGAAASSASLGSFTAGAAFGAGATYDTATGRLAACMAGGSVQAVTGGPAGLTRILLGAAESGHLTVLPYALADADLAARAAAIPL